MRRAPSRTAVARGRLASAFVAALLLAGPAFAQSSPYAGIYLGTFPACLGTFTDEIAILVRADGSALFVGGDKPGERGAFFFDSVPIAADGSFSASQPDGVQVSGVLDATSAAGSVTLPLACQGEPASTRTESFAGQKSPSAGFLVDAAGYYSADLSGSGIPFPFAAGFTYDYAGPFRLILDVTGHGVATWDLSLTYRDSTGTIVDGEDRLLVGLVRVMPDLSFSGDVDRGFVFGTTVAGTLDPQAFQLSFQLDLDGGFLLLPLAQAPRTVGLDPGPRPARQDLVIDFGPTVGLKAWMNHSTLVDLNEFSPAHMVAADLEGTGVPTLVADLGAGFGLWLYTHDDGWRRLDGASGEGLVAADLDGNGRDDVVVDFGRAPGARTGVMAWMNGSSWESLGSGSPERMAAVDRGTSREELIASFDYQDGVKVHDAASSYAKGLWTYSRSVGGWFRNDDLAIDRFLLVDDLDGDGRDELILDFGQDALPDFRFDAGPDARLGVWMRPSQAFWARLPGAASARKLAKADLGGSRSVDLVADLGPGQGVQVWRGFDLQQAVAGVAPGWAPLSPLSAQNLLVADLDGNGRDDVIADFGTGQGIRAWMNDTSWQQISPLSARSILATDLDAIPTPEPSAGLLAGAALAALAGLARRARA